MTSKETPRYLEDQPAIIEALATEAFLPRSEAPADTLILADDSIRRPSSTEWMIAQALANDPSESDFDEEGSGASGSPGFRTVPRKPRKAADWDIEDEVVGRVMPHHEDEDV